MKRNNATSNNTRRNTRSNNTRNAATQQVAVVVTDKRVAPEVATPTQDAAKQAERQAARDAKRAERQAAREREQRLTGKFVELTMSPNEAVRAIAAHTNDALEEGFTVGDWMKTFNWQKLTLKGLIQAVSEAAPALVQDGKLMLPTVKCATYESAPEDDANGKPVYYYVVKGKGAEARKLYKKAQTYGLEAVNIWTPKTVLQLLKAAMSYTSKCEKYAKRNAEVKAAKKFYLINEVNEKAVNGKSKCEATRTTTYVEIDAANVKWAE